jgi:hypothetical protein
VMPPVLDFLLRIALAIQGLFCFHMYFTIVFSIYVKNNHWKFDRDCIEHVDCFW